MKNYKDDRMQEKNMILEAALLLALMFFMTSLLEKELKGDDDDFFHSKAMQKITAHLQFFKSKRVLSKHDPRPQIASWVNWVSLTALDLSHLNCR